MYLQHSNFVKYNFVFLFSIRHLMLNTFLMILCKVGLDENRPFFETKNSNVVTDDDPRRRPCCCDIGRSGRVL